MALPKRLDLILGTAISLAILGYLLTRIRPEDILNVLRSISPAYLGLSFFVYLLILLMRTVRFRMLLSSPVPFTTMMKVTAAFYFFSNVLPLKTGEFTYIFLTKHSINIKTGERVMSWIGSRIFDFITIGIIFFIAYFAAAPRFPIFDAVFPIVAFIVATLCVLIYLLTYRGETIVRAVAFLARPLRGTRFASSLVDKLSHTTRAFEKFQSPRVLILLLITSTIIWTLQATFIILIFRSLGLEGITFGGGILLLLIAGLILLLPIQGLANLGTFEAGFTLALVTLGIATDKAIAYSFGMHIVQIAFMCIVGISALTSLFLEKRK